MEKALKKFALFGCLAVGALAGVKEANAQEVKMIPCDGCSTSRMDEIAQMEVDRVPNPYWGYLYFINRNTGSVAKYELLRDYTNPELGCTPNPYEVTLGCVESKFAFPVAPEQEVINFGIQLQAIWNTEIPITPGPGIPNDAYEFVEFPQGREAVLAQAHTKAALSSFLHNISSGLLDRILTNSPSIVSFILVLPDGSKLRAQWDPVTQKLVVEKGTVRDRSGNPVPETPADVSGGVGQTTYYDFSAFPADRFDFVSWLYSLGVPITGPAGSTQMRCTSRVTKNGQGEDVVTVECTAM